MGHGRDAVNRLAVSRRWSLPNVTADSALQRDELVPGQAALTADAESSFL